MICQNCGKNEVNFRYTQIINGVKKEMALCDKCAKSLGLESLDFNMPIDFSSFLGDFLGGASDTEFLPSFTNIETLQCNNCGMKYDEFIETGKFGCSHCYNIFSDGLDKVLKNIHGSSTHVGRKSRLTSSEKNKMKNNINSVSTEKAKQKNNETETKSQNTKEEKIEKLNQELKLAIKEERYEDAAKIRDEIKKISVWNLSLKRQKWEKGSDPNRR